MKLRALAPVAAGAIVGGDRRGAGALRRCGIDKSLGSGTCQRFWESRRQLLVEEHLSRPERPGGP